MHYVRKVTNDIYWVGANDHRLTLFENIHPIPKGTSYNSYLLMDEQTVLMDGIDWASCRQLLENIEFVLQGKSLDVLIVNHMEPDHGASMEELLLRYPQLKIVASKKAFMMMRQFGFNVDGHELVEVKEGDTMSFGTHTVQFVGAPMVHWPEAIVTFDTTDGVLFSADAFGSFGALDGKLFNDEINVEKDWLDEGRRYYTNIVGKYGPQVQSLLKKAAAIKDQIKYICPLHGVVWRNQFDYLLEKYQLWSTYEPEDKAVMIAYASMYGNTEAAAQALAGKLVERGITNTVVYDVSNTHVSYLISEAFRVSHIVLASVTYNMGIYPVMHNFLADMKALNLQNRMVALVENGSWAVKSGDLMQKFLDEEMKQMTVLNQRLSMASSLPGSKENELDQLADAIADSVREA